MKKILTFYVIISKVLNIIPTSFKFIIQGVRKTQVAAKYVNNEEFRNFYNANKNGFVNKNEIHTTQKLKWLQLQEIAKNGKTDKLITSKINKSKYLDSLLKKEIDIKPIGNITLEQNGNIQEKITIGYNTKTKKLEVATKNKEGYRVWETLKDSKIKDALNNKIREYPNSKDIKFNATMFDLDQNHIPKDKQQQLSEIFDKVAHKAFKSNPVFNENTQNLPDDFSENKENYIDKVFNIPTQKMNVKTSIEMPYIQMQYKGTDAGHHCFRPLYGMKNNNKMVFINQARFKQMNQNQHIEMVSKFDKRTFLGFDKFKNTIHFGTIQGKNNTITWQSAKNFFSDDTFSEQRRSQARLKLVNNDYMLEKGAVNLENNNKEITIKHHVNGTLMYLENQKESKNKNSKFTKIQPKDAERILTEYQKNEKIIAVKNRLKNIQKNIPIIEKTVVKAINKSKLSITKKVIAKTVVKTVAKSIAKTEKQKKTKTIKK